MQCLCTRLISVGAPVLNCALTSFVPRIVPGEFIALGALFFLGALGALSTAGEHDARDAFIMLGAFIGPLRLRRDQRAPPLLRAWYFPCAECDLSQCVRPCSLRARCVHQKSWSHGRLITQCAASTSQAYSAHQRRALEAQKKFVMLRTTFTSPVQPFPTLTIAGPSRALSAHTLHALPLSQRVQYAHPAWRKIGDSEDGKESRAS